MHNGTTSYLFLFRWKKINIKLHMTTLPDDGSFSEPAQLFVYYVSRTKDREAFRAVSRLCHLWDVCLNNITLKMVEMHKLTPTVRLYYVIHTLSSWHPSSSFTNCDLQHNRAVKSPAPLGNISPRAWLNQKAPGNVITDPAENQDAPLQPLPLSVVVVWSNRVRSRW